MKKCLKCGHVCYALAIKNSGGRCLCCGHDKFEDISEEQFLKDKSYF